MASLAQYSNALHAAPAAERTRPGAGSRWVGLAICAGIAVLVIVAAITST
jgi:hypothetical protein